MSLNKQYMAEKQHFFASKQAALDIVAKARAENRDLTPSEEAEGLAHAKAFQAERAREEQKTLEAENVKQQLADIGIHLGLAGGPVPRKASAARSSKARATQDWASRVREEMVKRSGTFGVKALIGGTIDIPSVISEPVLLDGRPTTLLDLIPRRPRVSTGDPRGDRRGNTFEFLRQTVRTLNAKGVPDGAQKPKSDITFESKEDHYRVYATTTDPIPKRYLDDFNQLIEILQDQLGEGLFESLEHDILLGTGVEIPEVVTAGVVTTQGEDPVRGILQTSGIQAQAYSGSVLNTLSSARYRLEDNRHTPNAWVMNSADYRALEMMREDGATGALMFGSGRSDIEAVLGDYPIVTSSLMTAGTALLGDFTKTELIVREDDHLDVDGSGELFKRNQVIFREEGRYGFAVLKPSSFVTVDLTA